MAADTLDIVYRQTDALVPYARNARQHSDEQIAQLVASIREFGFVNPVLIDEDGVIIAGHGRVRAAQAMGLTDLPTITLTGLTRAQRAALRMADNKLAENASWDSNLLRLELDGLKLGGFDLALTGFSSLELESLFANRNNGLTDPDDAPEAPAEPVSQLGDVWILGRHRLVCGDATSEIDVASCLAGVKPHLMVTDPPYGVSYDPTWRRRALRDGAHRAEGSVPNDGQSDWREAWALAPCDVAYVWHAGLHAKPTIEALESAGFDIRAQIIWAKNRLVLSRGHYHPQHEPCWYAVRSKAHWVGDRSQTTLWLIDHIRSETGHSAQKPIGCMQRPIENNSSPGQAIYDPFVGSGTSIIAAEMTGRACHALEIAPAYADVALLRWQAFTGQDARLGGAAGLTYNEVAAERRPEAA